MYIKNREKLEKALANLIKEMINQEMIDENKKEVADQYAFIKKPL
jgi:hypothetical protein